VNKDTLKQVISSLQAEGQVYEPFAGMYELSDGQEEYGHKIKANQEGLVQMAIALLKAAQQDYLHDGPQIIPLDIDDTINPDVEGFLPREIELTANPPARENDNAKKGNWVQRTVPATGCFLILAFILVSLAVGLVTVFKWIF
jgi:hypothetical protein